MVTVTLHNLVYDEDLRLPESGEGPVSITIEGHAVPGTLYREGDDAEPVSMARGENIVCAAVSFSGLTLVRSLEIIAGARPDYTVESGRMRLSLETDRLAEKGRDAVRVLLESFIIGMLDLEKMYGNYVTVSIDLNASQRNK